eukprot:4745204-Alexandrium_andersonii.AAC.1
MSASLVGSEMCIRDRRSRSPGEPMSRGSARGRPRGTAGGTARGTARPRPVSYTHLTLPTICSV